MAANSMHEQRGRTAEERERNGWCKKRYLKRRVSGEGIRRKDREVVRGVLLSSSLNNVPSACASSSVEERHTLDGCDDPSLVRLFSQ